MAENEIVASDTDALIMNIFTEDIYEDMKQIQNELDTSDYPENHNLYSEENKKKIGKFKDELQGKIMNGIVFLRSKAYSFTLTDLSEEKKLKGIGKTTIKKDIKFNDYKNCLFNNETKMNKMYTLNSDKHNMFINEINKVSLSPFDCCCDIPDNGLDNKNNTQLRYKFHKFFLSKVPAQCKTIISSENDRNMATLLETP